MTTEHDLERFCARFGNVIECTIFPVDEISRKRSGYVKFASCHSAEKMYHQSRDTPFSIDQSTLDIELGRGASDLSTDGHKKQILTIFNKKSNHSSTTYILHIEGQITNDGELIEYLKSKPLSIKFIEQIDDNGDVVKMGAQVTYNDKELVDRILEQKDERYKIKLVATKTSSKREHESQPSLHAKRSKLSQSIHSSIDFHLRSITKLTRDLHEENEHLQNDKNVLKTTVREQSSKIKQMEAEAVDLIDSSNKAHCIAKCITEKYKLREEEYQKHSDNSNKVILELETLLKTSNDHFGKAKEEIQYLTDQVASLEKQLEESTNRQSSSIREYEIEQFFLAVEQYLT
ncbi:unnamed protein product [Adineta ricciae]|uniref:RRM domain-containing protein n=1 Tax=Adineta ricciae TaxID=249248 RepID=A0A815FFC0_ADIRI|nr:unnamed protein product [Adineta ricciae]CAF1322713.1 unnamed protein product [Adineta ricciae]